MAPFQATEPFGFGDTAVVGQLRTCGMTFAEDPAVWHRPPINTLFIQRKLGGIYLLASRLKARIDVRAIL